VLPERTKFVPEFVKICVIWCATRRAVNINKNLCGCKSHTSQDADQLEGGAIVLEETKEQKLALTGEISCIS